MLFCVDLWTKNDADYEKKVDSAVINNQEAKTEWN